MWTEWSKSCERAFELLLLACMPLLDPASKIAYLSQGPVAATAARCAAARALDCLPTTAPCTRPSISAVAFEGYHFGASQADSRATCLCINGTRVVAAGAAADPTVELQAADGPLLAGGCWANMTWSQVRTLAAHT